MTTATGPRIAIAAAWLKSRSESTKRPTAKTQGCVSTVAEMAPTMAARFPSKKEEPIHDTPRIEMTAVSPPFMTLPLIAFSGSDRARSRSRPAAASITIIVARPISTWPVSVTPSPACS